MTRTSPAQKLFDKTLRNFWRGMLLAGGLTAGVNILVLVVPIYDLQIYDRVMNTRSVDTLVAMTLGVMLTMIICAFMDYLRSLVFGVLGDQTAQRLNIPTLQAALVESLRGQPGAASQAMRDLAELRNFILGPDVQIPLEFIWLPVYILVLFLLHPYFGIFTLGCSAFLLGINVLTDLMTRKTLARANDAQIKSFSEIGSTIRNAEVIEAMGMLPAVAKRWQARQVDFMEMSAGPTQIHKFFAAVSKASRLLMSGMVIALGAIVIMQRDASPGAIMAASLIVARSLNPFERLMTGWRKWIAVYAAYRRIRDLLGREGANRQEQDLPPAEGRLVVDRLMYLPPGSAKPVLRGVSFQLAPGEVLGIIGPSAAGKSTLARLIVGVFEPSSGGVFLDGISTFLWERDSFGRNIGYVPQNVALLDGTVRENIARMQNATPQSVITAARKALVHDMIGRLPFGYETWVGETGYSLSGGQRQRIALARALFGQPKLLVLDEPNANLDAAGDEALLQTIAAAKADGCTVLLIAHRPSIIAACDTLMVLKDGVIDHYGPRDQVLQAVTQPPNPNAPAIAPARVARLVKVSAS